MTSYLVTGGAGFIGSNYIRHVFNTEPEATIYNFDALTYAGVPATVAELEKLGDHRFIKGDVREADQVDDLMSRVDVAVNFAAESHVDRSIAGPSDFLTTNVVGTGILIDAAKRHRVEKFIQISTDEVYGSIAEGFASEEALLRPSSPYSASKAASDLLVLSYAETFGYKAIITRCTNNFGAYQFPEKLIPLFATNLLDGAEIPLYGDGLNQRDWLHVQDHCAAIQCLVEKGEPGQIYNVGADNQIPNFQIARKLLEMTGRDESYIRHVNDRPGHDRRYAVDSAKVRRLGWEPSKSFDDGLKETVEWYRTHRDWWKPLKATP